MELSTSHSAAHSTLAALVFLFFSTTLKVGCQVIQNGRCSTIPRITLPHRYHIQRRRIDSCEDVRSLSRRQVLVAHHQTIGAQEPYHSCSTHRILGVNHPGDPHQATSTPFKIYAVRDVFLNQPQTLSNSYGPQSIVPSNVHPGTADTSYQPTLISSPTCAWCSCG
ncbi:hypothetical protein IWX47DRAFT_415909 [Phyllosticta citricarpa]